SLYDALPIYVGRQAPEVGVSVRDRFVVRRPTHDRRSDGLDEGRESRAGIGVRIEPANTAVGGRDVAVETDPDVQMPAAARRARGATLTRNRASLPFQHRFHAGSRSDPRVRS